VGISLRHDAKKASKTKSAVQRYAKKTKTSARDLLIDDNRIEEMSTLTFIAHDAVPL